MRYSVVLIGALVLLLLILLALFRYFTSPIKQLVSEMEAIKAVKFDQSKVNLSQWQHSKNNEVHRLGASFKDMVSQINLQFSQLTENDRIRRELLTHLSHDLRTPLATMQGYLETMVIKGDRLSSQEQTQYLATAQRNGMQLKRLIDQIFELAHLEDGQVTVNLETFTIGELLHDIIAKFALKAKARHINLTLQPQQCQYIVYSDIAKLERIITNLLENALRHTSEGGEVAIRVSQLTDKVKIAVTDNGSGISKEDIAYIFDARYRASNAIEDSTPHAGLGLAISQKLSRILNSELFVDSQLGLGSNFSLSLPLVRP
jgi:signal transduction histidine kinase